MGLIPYWFIPTGAVIWLMSEYARTARVSVGYKRLLTGLTILSICVAYYWRFTGMAAQIIICIYIILNQILTSDPVPDSPS